MLDLREQGDWESSWDQLGLVTDLSQCLSKIHEAANNHIKNTKELHVFSGKYTEWISTDIV